jgi:PKD repeat protein
VQFTTNYGDADGDLMICTWDFGDGTTATGASVTHAYAAAGLYTVRVTLSDGQTETSQEMTVAVNEAGAGQDQSSFTIATMQVKLAFTAANKDALSLSGTIPIPAGFAPGGKVVRVIIGGLDDAITLNAKGQGAANNASLKITGKAKNGIFTASPAKFQYKIGKRTLLAGLQRFGLTNDSFPNGVRVSVQAMFIMDGVIYARDAMLIYKATKDKSGAAKKETR